MAGCDVTESVIPLPIDDCQAGKKVVGVVGKKEAPGEAKGSAHPSQEVHDEKRVAQHKGVVHSSRQLESHLPRIICGWGKRVGGVGGSRDAFGTESNRI